MKIIRSLTLVLMSTIATLSFAQTAQMTGKVVAVTSGQITVQQGTDVWDIKLNANTKVTGDTKVGSVVTVSYNVPDAQKKEGPVSNGTPPPAGE